MLSVFSERFADAVHAKAGKLNGCGQAFSRRTEERRESVQPGLRKEGSFVTARTLLAIGMPGLTDARFRLARHRRRQKSWAVVSVGLKTLTGGWPERDRTRQVTCRAVNVV